MARTKSTGSVKVAGTKKAAKPPKDKAAAKAARLARRTARKEKFGQVRQAFTMTRKADKRLVPLLLAASVRTVRRPLRITGLDRVLTLHDDVPSALVAVPAADHG